MPATTPKKLPFPESPEQGNGKMPKFVRVNLNKDQKDEMAKWANSLSSSDLLDYMEESVNAGYVLSWKEATMNGQIYYQCSLTMQPKEKVQINNNMSLVTRASSAMRAAWSLYYKHLQILEKDWSGATASEELEW